MKTNHLKWIAAACLACLLGAGSAFGYIKSGQQERWEPEPQMLYGRQMTSQDSHANQLAKNPAMPIPESNTADRKLRTGYDQAANADAHAKFQEARAPYGFTASDVVTGLKTAVEKTEQGN